jgi:hypothetical protein
MTSRGDGRSDVKANREKYVAFAACSKCDKRWRRGRWCYGRGCGDDVVEGGGGLAVSLIQHVGLFEPVGLHSDGPAAHDELQCFLSM